MSKHLTWGDLADFYKQKTGRSARIQPMDAVYEWAVRQPEIRVVNFCSKGGVI